METLASASSLGLTALLPTGSPSVSWARPPASITIHLCPCRRCLDALTVPLMWGVSWHCMVGPFSPWRLRAISTTSLTPAFLLIFFFHIPNLCLLLFSKYPPLSAAMTWHEDWSSVNRYLLPSSDPDVCSISCLMPLCGLSPLDLFLLWFYCCYHQISLKSFS